ncbi:hypothetical protein [Gimesia aquarii]|uniref:Uncharacterized protein n=1 Tax=Gimesia aquarii TaxID=2527964 RepID=A0A517WZU0_9PLAN|nr:hypothetical protein [Gimesia aquarii]QDU10765.1 hypothetical protein V202x_41770 [Gimesia aquarii]
MPNSNPACTLPQTYHCDCESGGTSYPLPNTLQVDYDLTDGVNTSTGTVTLKNYYQTPCIWEGQISFVCETVNGVKTKIFGFNVIYDIESAFPLCGWHLDAYDFEEDTPNATPGPCDTTGLFPLLSEAALGSNDITSCQCSPFQVGYYYQYNEEISFTLQIT